MTTTMPARGRSGGPARPPVPRAGKRERTRAALLDAAIGVIAEHGTEFACIDETVQRAGMARGTFYNYFETRDHLLRAVAQRMVELVDERVTDHVDPRWNAVTRVACLVTGFIEMGLKDTRLGWAWSRFGGHLPSLLANDHRKHPAIETAVRELTGTPGRPDAAYTLMSGTAQMTLRRMLEGALGERGREAVIGMLLRGLGAPSRQIPAALSIAREFAAGLALGPGPGGSAAARRAGG